VDRQREGKYGQVEIRGRVEGYKRDEQIARCRRGRGCYVEKEREREGLRSLYLYRGADKSLAPTRKERSSEARDFNNIETRALIKFLFSCKARRRRKLTSF
jgi:hypothetical protein